MKKVIDFLRNNIKEKDSLIVACSGGPDSMCLLDLVTKLKDELNLTIIVAHVNHKLRIESDEEAKMVEEFAKEHNLVFELMELNEYLNNTFTESDGRKKRYDFFNEVIKRYNANILLTAHHGDDLIETILMRLTRGSNLSGYIGIKEVSINDKYKILRPLLMVTKEDIIEYLESNNIIYAIDNTNKEMEHTRNRYRYVILPFLKKENAKVHEKYLKFSKELIEYDNFVNNYIIKNNYIIDNQIVINNIINESDFIKRKSLELLVKDIQNKDYFDISDEQMINLMKLYNQNNKRIDLNNNYQGINSYGKIFIKKKENKVLEEIIFNKDIVLDGFEFYYNSKDGNNTNSCIYLLSSEVSMPLKIRPIKKGDKMQVKNLNGSKKLSDIFINSKIPKEQRSTYPVIVDSNNTILWIPNIKKSQFSKDKSEKYDIIIRCKAR